MNNLNPIWDFGMSGSVRVVGVKGGTVLGEGGSTRAGTTIVTATSILVVSAFWWIVSDNLDLDSPS